MMDTLITAPAVEPVSLTEAKLHLRVDATDDNDLITALIVAAREWCEQYTRRALVTQTRELVLDKWPVYRKIHIPALPLQTVSSVKYTDEDGDESTLSAGAYVVDTARGVVALKAASSWPSDVLRVIAAVKVRYVAGYGDAAANVPRAIRQAMLLLIGEWYENRETVVTGTIRSGPLPHGVEALLSPYRNWPVEGG